VAQGFYKRLEESKKLKTRSRDAVAAACIFLACREKGFPRTFKGIDAREGNMLTSF